MFEHTQTVRRLLPTNCLSVLDHFVGLALKGLSKELISVTKSLNGDFVNSSKIPITLLRNQYLLTT